jgi:hypothetical protein
MALEVDCRSARLSYPRKREGGFEPQPTVNTNQLPGPLKYDNE